MKIPFRLRTPDSGLRTIFKLVAFVLIARAMTATGYLEANASQGQPALNSPSPVPSPTRRQQIPVENFLSGQVVKVSPDQIELKQPGRGNNIVLHLSPRTEVWSGLWVKSIPVAVGDRIDANVKRRPDGSFNTQQMWVNIINLVGNISSVEKKADGFQLSLQNRFVGSVIVKIDPRTQVLQRGKETLFGTEPVKLPKGEDVRVIGRRLRDGSVIATKLFLE